MTLQNRLAEQTISRLIKKHFGSQVPVKSSVFFQQLCQRQSSLSKTCDESPVEVHKSQEYLQRFHVLRGWSVLHSNDFVLGGLNAIVRDDMSQKIKRISGRTFTLPSLNSTHCLSGLAALVEGVQRVLLRLLKISMSSR